ncbi:hypothetical protein [Hyphomicrobium sulfonivorans]|uniref:hypothetical protein n=1 Tax=Hyphomicrobium sulfonivorans TaxID=121290 RepID=UPI00156E083D|nr:hypothetical protein [Hyphomicrobium sulfonivorans]MBI1651126.1 hypothetical protein [Hyphomicrobium sulfonivorans]NSL72490.1 hypothetical protein [Hyphomicrobium sulfonivorans]
MRLFVAGVCLAATMSQASAQQAHTTRIETRPYYGAVVTIEHGVRVYRPVPPTRHLIINPDGAAAVELNVGTGVSTGQTAGNVAAR